ncbi:MULTISPECIES: MFS transporter [Lactobacillus]|uniref:MFS transporter n=1 Tax=Lactobacillus xujianguonis TaxID=2495899 RepID=A0A437STS5_9LACO|nr:MULTISPECIES: MFS transporter [Lactobacillus]RVU70341.1 MFS transporter [Lactobacillus xujianguonis]RVU76884.1 MFS transporter [Lactobacillus xujianguonis]
MKSNRSNPRYRRLSFSLYLNYVVHGFGLLILAQNMSALSKAWNVPLAVVSYVISGVGIGRLLAYLITGYFSDKLSRKFFVYLGMACYFIFAVGIPFSKSIPLSYFFAILAGVANSALDAGTYTTFVEMANGNGRYNVLIKAVASIGEFIIPLLVSMFANLHAWYGWSFMVMAALLIINAILLLPLKFPKHYEAESTEKESKETKAQGKKLVTTVLFVIYGYLSMALMIWYTQWITLFGNQTHGFSNLQSHFLLSLYSIGSIIGVLLLFVLLGRNVSETGIMIAMNVIATLSLAVLIFTQNVHLSEIASFMFGFSAASGVMQTGLTAFMRLYPSRRGLVTGVFYFFGAIASFTVPIITGVLSKQSIGLAFGADIVIGLIACVVVTLIAILMRKVDHLPEK